MKLRKINEVSLTASNINVGDVIKVGANAYLKIDKIPADLQAVFDTMSAKVQQSMKNPRNTKLLEQNSIPMSHSLFTNLFVFTRVIAETFPGLACYDDSRQSFYAENQTANLSELFERHLFQCAEFAVVAQMYLQSIGVDSEYVGGEFLGNQNWEFGDQHSFVIIHENDKDFVFDPANNNSGNTPNISVVELTPKQKVKIQAKLLSGKRKVAFFETRDIITNRKAFYGYGDGANVSEDMIFKKELISPNVFVKDFPGDNR